MTGQDFYKSLLKLYPAKFRKRFGGEMLSDWIDLYNDNQKQNKSAIIFWTETLYDTAVNCTYEHLTNKEKHMAKSKIGNKLSLELLGLSIAGIILILTSIPIISVISNGINHSFHLGAGLVTLGTMLILLALSFVGLVVNIKMVIKGETAQDPKYKLTILAYSLAMIVLFTLVLVATSYLPEISVLMFTVSALSLTNGLWTKWLKVGALVLCGVLLLVLTAIINTNHLDEIFFDDNMLYRGYEQMCEEANQLGENPAEVQRCEIEVKNTNGSYKVELFNK
jgi:hypothetical protein